MLRQAAIVGGVALAETLGSEDEKRKEGKEDAAPEAILVERLKVTTYEHQTLLVSSNTK